MNTYGKSIIGIQIPGTFPTNTVLDSLRENAGISIEWNKTKVENLYDLYLDAIQAGEPVYQQGQIGALAYIEKNSNYPHNEISVFLYMLGHLASTGDIDVKYWNIPLQEKRSILPGAGLQKSVDKMSDAVKWGSIALMVGAGIYFSWPFIKKFRRKS